MNKDEEIRLLKRLDELEPQIKEEIDVDKLIKDFWQYVYEREKEEQIIGERNL